MSGRLRRLARGIGPPLVSTLVAIALFCGVGELVARARVPFASTRWPSRTDARAGDTFVPGAEVRWTNGVDFWTTTRASSIGFLDREPPGPKTPGACRVLFLGDSFVEAAQVPIEQKSHVVLERLHRERHPTVRFETMALGRSGTGQANQIAYYDAFGRDFAPDVVVLVVIENDFANNSPVLEAVRNGWHPEHVPRLFFRRDPTSGGFAPLPIDPEFASKRLPSPAEPLSGVPRRIGTVLHARSAFYGWVLAHASAQYPSAVALLTGPSPAELAAFRTREIERIPGYAGAFEGWHPPDDLDLDRMFFADSLPPAFADAEALTGHALDELAARGGRDGFRLVALASYGLSQQFAEGATEHGRSLVDAGALERLEALLAPREIPLVDQLAWIRARGESAEDAHFQRDGHWSPRGHAFAAEALLDHLARAGPACSRAPAPM